MNQQKTPLIIKQAVCKNKYYRSSRCMLKCSGAAMVLCSRLWTVQIPLSSAVSLQFYKVLSFKCGVFCPCLAPKGVEQILRRCLPAAGSSLLRQTLLQSCHSIKVGPFPTVV